MSSPNPSISVNVDPTNPGQFFACCGLLELADRLWPGAEGWFETGRFHVTGPGTLGQILGELVAANAEAVTRLENGLEVKPIVAPLRLTLRNCPGELMLDAWMTIRVEKGEVVAGANPPWNFWSGQMKSHPIWVALRGELGKQLQRLAPAQLPDIFNQRVFQGGRFGFDPAPAWNALDVGFSPNEQNMQVESSPAVELLAAVGLQRYRPRMGDDRDSFTYATWGAPLPPSVASAAACASVRFDPSVRFRGRVVSRGQYAALAYSTTLPGGSDE